MARRKVTVTIWIDPTEYHEAIDTAQGAVDLVAEILTNGADFPDDPPLILESSDGATVAIKTVTP